MTRKIRTPRPGTKTAKILQLYLAGMPHKQIAHAMGIKTKTVSALLCNINATQGRSQTARTWTVKHDPSGLFAPGAAFDEIFVSLRMSAWPIGIVFERSGNFWQVLQGDEHQELQQVLHLPTEIQGQNCIVSQKNSAPDSNAQKG